jgi:primosomal protein N'
MSYKGILLAHKKSLKKNYKHLDLIQKKIIKAVEKKELAEKELYGARGFYANAPRTEYGVVNWDALTQEQNNLFNLLNKNLEKSSKYLSKFTDKEIENAKEIFKLTQFNYSQSF